MQNKDNTGLLETLKKLYAKILVLYLNKRQHSYQATANGGSEKNITSDLADRIQQAAEAGKAANATPTSDSAQPTATEDNSHRAALLPVENKVTDGLSEYFHTTHTHSSFLTETGEKLKISTLEHIHTALRYARQGETKTANIHADIASSALKEAAHYLSTQDYAAFVATVDVMLVTTEQNSK